MPAESQQKPLKKEIKLPFPTSGVWKRLAYDEQPQKYAGDALNVWPDDSITNRERGGSRPGIEDLGGAGGGPIRTINHMVWTNASLTTPPYNIDLITSSAGSLYYSRDQGGSWNSAGSGLYSDRPVSVACHLQRVYACATASPYLKFWDPGFNNAAGRYIDATPGASYNLTTRVATPGTYTTGTITLVDGSTTVTGGSTTFPEWAASGYIYVVDDNGVQSPLYTVSFRNSNTLLTLDVPFTIGDLTFSGGISGINYTLAIQPAPPQCTLAVRWHDRVILAGDLTNPHLFYGSRIGDGRDWLFSQPFDKLCAFACNSIPGAGAVGDQITSLIPMDDDTMFIGSSHGLSILHGDPLDGGTMKTVSETIGPLGQNSWCKIPHQSGDWLAMMTKQGLYVVPPGGRPTPVSREVIPAELGGLDPSTYETAVGYDLHFHGLVASVSPRSGSSGIVNYFIKMDTVEGGGGTSDILHGSFWPQSFPTISYQPFAMYDNPTFVQSTGSEGSLMMGCKDGTFRRFNAADGQDSGANNVTAWVGVGPFALGDQGYNGILKTLEVFLAAGSDPMMLDVMVGNSAEEAFNAQPFMKDSSGVYPADYVPYAIPNTGTNYTLRINARGAYCYLKFYGAVNARFSWEKVIAWVLPKGKIRIG